MGRIAVLVALGLLSGCSRAPRFEPIPEQAAYVEAPDPPVRPCFVAMSEPRATAFILNDISKDAGWKRWTGARPAVRCTLPRDGSWQAEFDFAAVDVTLKDTGPITLTFTVNGRAIGTMRCDHEAMFQFRVAVPKDLAKAGQELILEAAVDKPWVSPGDGAKLGVLVSAAGFLEE